MFPTCHKYVCYGLLNSEILTFVSTEATPSDDPTDEPVEEEEVTTGSKSDKLSFFQKLFGIQNRHSGSGSSRSSS